MQVFRNLSDLKLQKNGTAMEFSIAGVAVPRVGAGDYLFFRVLKTTATDYTLLYQNRANIPRGYNGYMESEDVGCYFKFEDPSGNDYIYFFIGSDDVRMLAGIPQRSEEYFGQFNASKADDIAIRYNQVDNKIEIHFMRYK